MTTLIAFNITHRGPLPDGFDYEAQASQSTHQDPNRTRTIATAPSRDDLLQQLDGVEGIIDIQPARLGYYNDDTEDGVYVGISGQITPMAEVEARAWLYSPNTTLIAPHGSAR